MKIDQTLRHSKQPLAGILEETGVIFKGNECRCPFHDDTNPSAGLYESEGGVWRFKCHGCGVVGDYYDIKAKLAKTPLAEMIHCVDRQKKSVSKPKIVYTDLDRVASGMNGKVSQYHYTHPETQKLEMVIFRIEPPSGKKYFRPLSPCEGGFKMEAPKKPWPLYNRTRVLHAERIIVVEGEKCVHALNRIGVVATTAPFGAGKASHADWLPLRGKDVYLWPDNHPHGIEHMEDVEKILDEQERGHEITTLNVENLDLPEGGDVCDYLIDLYAEGLSFDECRKEIEGLCKESRRPAPSSELYQSLEKVIDGKFRTVHWPWESLTGLTNALLPGTLTVLAGPPCAGKSLFVLDCMSHWLADGVSAACLALEESRAFYSRRLLSQLAGNSDFLDNDFVEANPQIVLDAFALHHNKIDQVIENLYVPQDSPTSLAYVSQWLLFQATKKTRVLIVDPVTIAEGLGEQVWVDDKKFVAIVGKIATEYNCSILLVTHPRKGRKGAIGLDEISGGTAYTRFAQCVLWIQDHRPAIDVDICQPAQMYSVRVNRTVKVLKARNARGTGKTVGMNLCGDNLKLTEMGIISNETQKK